MPKCPKCGHVFTAYRIGGPTFEFVIRTIAKRTDVVWDVAGLLEYVNDESVTNKGLHNALNYLYSQDRLERIELGKYTVSDTKYFLTR